MKLYKPTKMKRVTVSQEARIIIPSEEGAPDGSLRNVQITIPDSPVIFADIDRAIQMGFRESGIGPNRTYSMPFLPTGQSIVFHLLPHQFVTAMAEEGLAFLSTIIEYIENP